jgi:hypothetical protein
MSSASEAELAALYYGLFFDHVKNSLDNHSVWVFQQVNSVSTMAANDIMNDIYV